MSGHSLRRYFKIGLLLLPILAGVCVPAAGKEPARVKVELRLKVLAARPGRGFQACAVEVIDSAWNTVETSAVFKGSSPRFKNLRPDIYTVCITGPGRVQRCRSVDLIPAPGRSTASFRFEMEAPDSGDAWMDTHTVSVASLAVPAKARIELQRSLNARRRGETAKASRHLRRALEICPDYAQALNDLGAELYRKGDYTQAIAHFTRALALEPNHYASWVNLGKSHMAMGNYPKAIEASRRAFGFHAEELIAAAQLALSHYYMKDFVEAKKHFQRLAELDPASAAMPHLYLARIALAENRREEGASYLRDFLALHPNVPQARRYRAVLNSLAQLSAAGGPGNFPMP